MIDDIYTIEESATSPNHLMKVMNKPGNQVTEAALKRYISEQTDQIAGIQQTQKSLEKGAGKDFKKVVEKLRTKIRDK